MLLLVVVAILGVVITVFALAAVLVQYFWPSSSKRQPGFGDALRIVFIAGVVALLAVFVAGLIFLP